MYKIMFVCHGNICRSPMAEYIFKDLCEKQGVAEKYYISSSATSREEIWNGIGNPVYSSAKAELKAHGISCDGKRAVQITAEDYKKYDLRVVMDSNNMRNLFKIVGNDTDGKIKKLMSFAGQNKDVSDPWYSGDFATCYQDILLGCTALLKTLENECT